MRNFLSTTLENFKLEGFHQGEFKTIKLDDIKNNWSLFFFYPADFTFVCPTELVDLAEKHEQLNQLGVQVYSVSTDTHFTHKAWYDHSDSIKKVTYPMLADPTGHLSKKFGVYNDETGLALRGTFLVSPIGQIKFAEVNDDGIGRNADEILRKVQAALFVHKNPHEVCPAKWKPGQQTLKPSLDLVGKI